MQVCANPKALYSMINCLNVKCKSDILNPLFSGSLGVEIVLFMSRL